MILQEIFLSQSTQIRILTYCRLIIFEVFGSLVNVDMGRKSKDLYGQLRNQKQIKN